MENNQMPDISKMLGVSEDEVERIRNSVNNASSDSNNLNVSQDSDEFDIPPEYYEDEPLDDGGFDYSQVEENDVISDEAFEQADDDDDLETEEYEDLDADEVDLDSYDDEYEDEEYDEDDDDDDNDSDLDDDLDEPSSVVASSTKNSPRNRKSGIMGKIQKPILEIIDNISRIFPFIANLPLIGKFFKTFKVGLRKTRIATGVILALLIALLLSCVLLFTGGNKEYSNTHSFPDNGHLTVTSFEKNDSNIVAHVNNDGAVIASDVDMTVEVHGKKFLKPSTWFSDNTISTCKASQPVTIKTGENTTVELVCDNSMPSIKPMYNVVFK